MQYLLLIFNRETEWAMASEQKRQQIMAGHAELQKDLRTSGKYRFCGGLAGASSATCVNRRDGKLVVTDGPFAEAREQVGGYYVVDAKDLPDAIELAKKIPLYFDGMTVEIRQVVTSPD